MKKGLEGLEGLEGLRELNEGVSDRGNSQKKRKSEGGEAVSERLIKFL